MMRCYHCQHWTATKSSARLPIDQQLGECARLDHRVTDATFFCADFEPRQDAVNEPLEGNP